MTPVLDIVCVLLHVLFIISHILHCIYHELLCIYHELLRWRCSCSRCQMSTTDRVWLIVCNWVYADP